MLTDTHRRPSEELGCLRTQGTKQENQKKKRLQRLLHLVAMGIRNLFLEATRIAYTPGY